MAREVKVLFFASLREHLGRDEVVIPLKSPCSMKEFLSILWCALPENARHLILSNERSLREGLLIFLNRALIDPKKVDSIVVSPGAELAIAPPASGG